MKIIPRALNSFKMDPDESPLHHRYADMRNCRIALVIAIVSTLIGGALSIYALVEFSVCSRPLCRNPIAELFCCPTPFKASCYKRTDIAQLATCSDITEIPCLENNWRCRFTYGNATIDTVYETSEVYDIPGGRPSKMMSTVGAYLFPLLCVVFSVRYIVVLCGTSSDIRLQRAIIKK